MQRTIFFAACALCLGSNASADGAASAASDHCKFVASEARTVMTARQFGLSYQDARLHLAKGELRTRLVNAAYQFPVESGNLKPFEAIDAFSADWRKMCMTSDNDQK